MTDQSTATARAEADGLRAKIEAHNRGCNADCTYTQDNDVGCTGRGDFCDHCPRRYIIELPERAKG